MTMRLVQLGLGGWGRSWVDEVARRTPGIVTVAWVDPDPTTRANAVAALALPPERVFASLDAARAAVTADAALIVVPLAAHAVAARSALEIGLDVLVEKPFTTTLAEAAALVALARAGGRKLMVSQNYRWFAAPRLARRLIGAGAIGRPTACYLDFHFYYGPGYRYFFLDEPLLSDMAIHHFDALRFVLGDEPVEVACQSWNEPESPFKGRPAAIVTVRMAGGTIVSYRGSWISRGPTTPYGGNWRIDGTAGAIEMAYRGAGELRERTDRLQLYGREGAPSEIALPAMQLMDRKGALDAFAQWVGGAAPGDGLSTGEDNLRSLALMFAAIRSASLGGAPVRIADVLAEVLP